MGRGLWRENQLNSHMKYSEIKLEPSGFRFSTKPAGHLYKFIMSQGRAFPTNPAQARQFIKGGGGCQNLDVLNFDDAQFIESFLNKHGLQGDYRYTKSGEWVRLVNTSDIKKAVRLEFGI